MGLQELDMARLGWKRHSAWPLVGAWASVETERYLVMPLQDLAQLSYEEAIKVVSSALEIGAG